MSNQIRAWAVMSWYALKASLRNKSTILFTIIFPIVLIAALGLIGGSGQSVKIGFPDSTDQNNLIVAQVKQIPIVKPQAGTRDTLDAQLKRGKIDGILEVSPKLPANFDVTLFTSSANPQASVAVQTVVRSVIQESNLHLAGIKNPPISLINKEVSGRKSRYIDFILPGQIGFSMLSTALFGTVFGFLALRRLLVLKRMIATPVWPITILLAQATSRLIVVLMQTSIILGVGVILFHFYLPHGWVTFFQLLFLSTLGLIGFLGFGFFLSGIADDENSAGPLVQLVSLPQMLLSGVFFATDSLPGWLQPIANNLPLSYFNQAVRKITTEGGSFSDTIPYLVGFLAWGLVMYLLATRTFKWE